jgi:hypothetical protein
LKVVVFRDENGGGVRDEGEPGIAKVPVSYASPFSGSSQNEALETNEQKLHVLYAGLQGLAQP